MKLLIKNLLKWIALGLNNEYPFRQSIHLFMFYTSLCVYYYTRLTACFSGQPGQAGTINGTTTTTV